MTAVPTETHLRVVGEQLARMRGMNAAYHRRFFADVRFTLLSVLGLFVAGAAVNPWLFLAVPLVTIVGANQAAFDASYLVLSRHYAARLERYLNRRLGSDLLVAHRLENAYLFPLDTRKVVTLPLTGPPTWFGFMTAFYAVMGGVVFVVGLLLSLGVLVDARSLLVAAGYLGLVAVLTLGSLLVGVWWFVGGEGERRLRDVLDEAFPDEAGQAGDDDARPDDFSPVEA